MLRSSSSYLPGLRILKTGLAVFLCLLIYLVLKTAFGYDLELCFYAVIAVIISMDKTISHSFTAGRNRLIGTFCGAAIGCIFAVSLRAFEHPLLIPAACGAGVILLIWLLNRLKLNNSIVIASIVFLAIMVGFGNSGPVKYSLLRMLDTMIGIVIAWLVNILVFPYDNLALVRSRLECALSLSAECAGMAASGLRQCNLRKLSGHIAAFRSESALYNVQFTWGAKMSARRLIREQLMLDGIFSELTVLARLSGGSARPDGGNLELLADLGIAVSAVSAPVEPTASSEDIIYNHHLRRLLELIAGLRRRSGFSGGRNGEKI